MSTNHGKQSDGRPLKVEKVPILLNPMLKASASPVGQSKMDKYHPVMILIAGRNFFEQVTIHRPIGQTDLDKDSWVATPTSDVAQLLSRSENPSQKEITTALANLRKATTIRLGYYVEAANGELSYPPNVFGGEKVNVHLEHAKALHKAAEQVAHQEYLDERAYAGKKPSPDWKYGISVAHFVDEAHKEYDTMVSSAVKADAEYQTRAKVIDPGTYRTKAGPLADRPQRALNIQAKGEEQLVEMMNRGLIIDTLTKRPMPGEREGRIRAAFKAAGDDPAKLQDFILHYAFPFLSQ
mgnify:CR=1 FL=1